jgi:glycosyltransferase involved in cell wall biosynthesis
MLNILWLAPNFNHYKARFLNHLAKENDVNLTIISGSGRTNMGDVELLQDWEFELIRLNISKKKFGSSIETKKLLSNIFNNYDWILIPAEKKNIPLFQHALKLRRANNKIRLFSYNHAKLKSKNSFYKYFDSIITKFFNKNLDRVIFYNEGACKHAIENKLVNPKKAFWANNTVDNTEIEKYYTFNLPKENQITILFIGRLVPSKQISEVIKYYNGLKQNIENLKLEIIGDGPESDIVKAAVKDDVNIVWHGALIDEVDITPIMARTSLVFVPGLSGLSINHAFAYGRPYVTIEAIKHGPELSYIEHGKNGYILKDNFNENLAVITNLLKNQELLNSFFRNAKEKGEQLSVQCWIRQIKSSLLHE